MLSFGEFENEARKYMELKYQRQINIQDVQKNNGVTLRGLTVLETESNTSPTLYLNEYYECYKNGDLLKNLLEELSKTYETHQIPKGLDMKFFFDFDSVKDSIVYKIINYERNKKMLNEMPYVRFLDLAVVFYVMLENNSIGSATITIRNNHLGLWGVSQNTIYDLAKENIKKLLPIEVCKMEEILLRIMKENTKSGIQSALGVELTEEMEKQMIKSQIVENASDMYVVTNRTRINGAVVILDEDSLRELADRLDANLIILPSSIHEIIVIKKEEKSDIRGIREMVKEINETQVICEEFLSNNVYEYSRKDHQVKIMDYEYVIVE